MTALRIPGGIVLENPMSSGRLGPDSRAPSWFVRKNEASPPGPESRSAALPMIAFCSASRDGKACTGQV
jgi:hypothetical protein